MTKKSAIELIDLLEEDLEQAEQRYQFAVDKLKQSEQRSREIEKGANDLLALLASRQGERGGALQVNESPLECLGRIIRERDRALSLIAIRELWK